MQNTQVRVNGVALIMKRDTFPGGGGGGAGTHSHRETEGCNGSRGLTMTSPKLTQDSEKKPFDKSVGF